MSARAGAAARPRALARARARRGGAAAAREGVVFDFGSDAAQPNPFLDLFFAVTHPFHPGEALTVEQAVTACTRGSAYAEFQDWQKGALKPGYLADLAVLSQDIFTVPPSAIPGTTSVLTVVGGEIVWDAGVVN